MCCSWVAPHSLLLDIAGAAEAFRLVNTRHAEQGKGPHFRLRFAGLQRRCRHRLGCRFALEPLPDAFATTTWVVLVGQPSVHVRRATPEVIAISHWLSRVMRPRLAAADSRGSPADHLFGHIARGALWICSTGAAARRITTCWNC
jgi:hypothetical protein